MTLFDVIAILLTLTALLSYCNHRYLGLHPTVGVLFISLLISLAVIALGHLGFGITAAARQFMQRISFGEALLTWMLGFLLFAGALTVDISELRRQWQVTSLLAAAGTVASMFIVAALMHYALGAIGASLPWIDSFLFGALISPTDPVAVIAVTRQAGAGKAIDTIVSSESLLNDGVGVVLFLTLLKLAPGAEHATEHVTAAGVGFTLLRQAGGGAVLGCITGLFIYRLLIRTSNFQVEILLTLALAMGTYSLASALGTSGPIAVVAAGLLIGNRGKLFHMSSRTSLELEHFWELIDEVINAVLFVLVGVQMLVISYTLRHFLAALIAIPIVLFARAAVVAIPVALLPLRPRVPWSTAAILIWGGLRGGLAIAMALSLPQSPYRELIVAITYGVVCFSILVQGTTIRQLVQRAILFAPARSEPE
jgi:CPA1 family monovalent cation:H+ antiporter